MDHLQVGEAGTAMTVGSVELRAGCVVLIGLPTTPTPTPERDPVTAARRVSGGQGSARSNPPKSWTSSIHLGQTDTILTRVSWPAFVSDRALDLVCLMH